MQNELKGRLSNKLKSGINETVNHSIHSATKAANTDSIDLNVVSKARKVFLTS